MSEILETGQSRQPVLLIQQSLSGHPAPRREKGQRVAGTIKGGSGERGCADPSDGNGGGLVDVAGTLGGGSGERGWQQHDGAGAFVPIAHTLGTRNTKGTDERGDGSSNLQPVWPAEVASTLDAHFGDKWGLEDQHINSGASHFVPAVVGTMACNTGPKGHDAGNFQSNQGVDSGYVIPVEQPMCIKGAAIGRKPEAGPQYGEVLTDGSSYTLNASETHGVLAFAQNTREEVRIIGEDGDVSGSLSAETGTHQSTYLVFDTTQVTSKTNRSNPQVGDPCHTLAKGSNAPTIAFTGMAHAGQGWAPPSCPTSEDCALPLDTKRAQSIAYMVEQNTQASTPELPSIRANETPNYAVAYETVGFIHPRQLRNSQSSNQVGIKPDADISDALTGEGPGAISFRTNQTSAMGPIHSIDVTDSLAVDHPPATISGMQVRRLTPVECERLQGIPDNFTKITEKSSDGPRYKMIGNGFAVPCVAWIGKRIQMVEDMK